MANPAETGRALAKIAGTLALWPVRELVELPGRHGHSLSHRQNERESQLVARARAEGQDVHWYPRDFPVRQHNRLTALPHGATFFPDLVEHLLNAESRVTVAGWCLTPLMPLLRSGDEGASQVVQVLRKASERAEVYLLLWSGAPVLFRPTDDDQEAVLRIVGEHAPRVHCALDRSAPFSHDQHQKAITIDGKVAYVGGMDLTTFQGDRWDTAEHPLRFGAGWHDVQMRLEGEVVRDVEENFCQRWQAVTGHSMQPLEPLVEDGWNTPAQIVRTIPAGFYNFAPDGIYGIRHALLAAIRGAQHFIYLESQYLWAPEIVDALLEAMNRERSGQFRIVLVLPAHAYTGKYDNDVHVKHLRAADAGRGIFHAFSIYATGPCSSDTGYRGVPIYVHAKVAIVDDQWVCLGSANLNQRGLANDAELNVLTRDPALARDLRLELWAEHLGMSRADVEGVDPIVLVDGPWQHTAERVKAAVHNGDGTTRGQALSYEVGRALSSRILDLMQEMTLEH